MLTQEILKERLVYKDGKFLWKKSNSNVAKNGTEAGTLNKVGYRQISITINGKRHLMATHKLVYLYHYGYIPKEIDHINLIKTDNRLENLREATRSQNIVNNKPRKDNTSGYRGIYFCKSKKKWIARIWHNKQKVWSSSFVELEDAVEQRKKKMIEIYGDFVRI